MDIVFSPAAERDLKKLSKENQRKVFSALEEWKLGEKDVQLEKLKGYPKFYRMRAGNDFRIIFHPRSASQKIILVIRNRKSAYRGLNQLHGKLERYLQIIEQQAISALTDVR